MVDTPFTERYGGDMERYRADSGLVEGEVGWREEGDGRGGEGQPRGEGREGGDHSCDHNLLLLYYSRFVIWSLYMAVYGGDRVIGW